MHRSVGAVTARRRPRRTNDDETQSSCRRCIFAAIICASVTLLIGGTVLMFNEKSAAVQRASMVEPFDDVVVAWRDGQREDFEKSAYTVTLKYSGVESPRAVDGQAIDMPSDTYKDFLSPDETYHQDLETYQALKYRTLVKAENLTDAEQGAVADMEEQTKFLQIPQEWLKEPLPKASVPFSPAPESEVIIPSDQTEKFPDLWVETKATMNFTISLTSEDGLTSTHTISNIPVGLARMTRNNFKSCRPRGGIHMGAAAGHHCTILLTVSRICLVVSKDANDHWEVAPDKQASCLRHCAYPCQQHNNGTVLYMPNRMASSARPGAVGKGPLEIIVRSAEDPFVFAMNLTDGSLSFGPSSDDYKTHAIVCFVLGIVLAVPAIAHFAIEYLDVDANRRAEAYRIGDLDGGGPGSGGMHTARPIIDEPIGPLSSSPIMDKSDSSQGTPRIRTSSSGGLRAGGAL